MNAAHRALRYDEAGMIMSDARWLTAKRLRAHALLLGIALWSLYLWTLATPGLRDRNGNLKGTDFLHFYTLGSIAAAHRGGELYNMNVQAALAAQRVPEAAGIRYLPLYPPQVSIVFAPLAGFSYATALAIWWAFCVLVYAACSFSIWRTCPSLNAYGGTVALVAIAFPGFFNLIAWGQTSAIALASFTAMFFLLRNRREFLAGIALGCLAFKPQLGLAAAVVFFSIGAWRTIAGAILSAAVQLSVGALYYGIAPLREWLHDLTNIREVMPLLEPKPYQTHCLRTFWSMLVPWPALSLALYLISAAFVLYVLVSIWKRPAETLPLRYSALLLATVLISPHLTVYDLVILAPAILVSADRMITDPSLRQFPTGTLLYLVYALPLLGPVTRYIHVQLSVIAMMALLCVMWKASCANENKGPSGQMRVATAKL